MIDPSLLKNLALRGGFTIVQVEFTAEALIDALGREAIARTQVVGHRFEITIRSGLSNEELSVTLYHEISRSCRGRIFSGAAERDAVQRE